MKKETYQAKLLALLGDAIPDHVKQHLHKSKKINQDVPISEKDIQDFRSAQGLVYFLQAPELFTAQICKHCKESFLVSRKFIGYCSYTCIRLSLEAMGFEWRKGEDIEALVNDPQVYNKNEPIWIRNLDKIKEILNDKNTSSTSS